MDPALDPVRYDLHSDHAGRRHKDAVLRDSQRLSGRTGRYSTELHSFFARTGICDPAVDDHSPGAFMMINDILIPFYRCGFDDIRRKGSCRMAGFFTEQHRHVGPAFIFDPGCRAGCKEALCAGGSSFNNLHNLFSCSFLTETSAAAEVLHPRQSQTSGSCSELPARPPLLQDCRERPS